MHYRLVDDKYVSAQIHDYHILVNNFKKEEIFIPEQFIVGCLIKKLQESWKHYIKTLKHKKKQVSLEDAIIHIRIEEKNQFRDASNKAKDPMQI